MLLKPHETPEQMWLKRSIERKGFHTIIAKPSITKNISKLLPARTCVSNCRQTLVTISFHLCLEFFYSIQRKSKRKYFIGVEPLTIVLLLLLPEVRVIHRKLQNLQFIDAIAYCNAIHIFVYNRTILIPRFYFRNAFVFTFCFAMKLEYTREYHIIIAIFMQNLNLNICEPNFPNENCSQYIFAYVCV